MKVVPNTSRARTLRSAHSAGHGVIWKNSTAQHTAVVAAFLSFAEDALTDLAR